MHTGVLTVRYLVEIGEGLVERYRAILAVIDDDRLLNMRHRLVQPPLRQSGGRRDFDLPGDLGADAAVADESAITVDNRRPTDLVPALLAIRPLAGIDEIAVGLFQLMRQQRHLAHFRIDPHRRNLGEPLADHLGLGPAEQRLGVARDQGETVLRILLPVVVRRRLENAAELLLALAQGLLGFDPGGDVRGNSTEPQERTVLGVVGRAVRLEPNGLAARQVSRIDEIVEGLPGLDRRQARSARLGRDHHSLGFGQALAVMRSG